MKRGGVLFILAYVLRGGSRSTLASVHPAPPRGPACAGGEGGGQGTAWQWDAHTRSQEFISQVGTWVVRPAARKRSHPRAQLQGSSVGCWARRGGSAHGVDDTAVSQASGAPGSRGPKALGFPPPCRTPPEHPF